MRHLRLDWQVLIVQELPLLTYLDMKHIYWLGIEWQLHYTTWTIPELVIWSPGCRVMDSYFVEMSNRPKVNQLTHLKVLNLLWSTGNGTSQG